MDNQELKDFIGVQLGQLTQEMSRLAASVERQNSMIQAIDIKTTTRITELQKDIDNIKGDIVETRQAMIKMDESQKFKWKTLSEERAVEKRDRESKDRMQAVKNSQMETVNKVLWAIFAIVLSLFIGFVWQMLMNGGLKGMIVP